MRASLSSPARVQGVDLQQCVAQCIGIADKILYPLDPLIE